MAGVENRGWLVQRAGLDPGKRYAIDGEMVNIGRGTACQIQLSDPKVSRTHARLIFINQELQIEDLNSAHGVLINGRQVQKSTLANGERIKLGDTELIVELSSDSIGIGIAPPIGGEQVAERCRYCGAPFASIESYCPGCGSITSKLPEPFEFVQQAYLQLRALHQSGKMDRTTFRTELEKMIISDGSGGYWMVGIQSGHWYWFDGTDWVLREPPTNSLKKGTV